MTPKVYKPERNAAMRRKARQEYEEEDIDEYNRNASRKARKGCLVFFIIMLVVVLGTGLFVYSAAKKEIDGYNATAITPVSFTVPSGSTSSGIGKLLEENGLIGSSNTFKLYVKFINKNADFKAGTFELTPGMTYDEIIAVLSPVDGAGTARATTQIQILEGKSVMHIASLFEEAGLCTAEEFLAEADNLDAFNDLPFIQKLQEDLDPNVFHTSEGYLFPDTYIFYQDDTAHNMVRKLYEEMDEKITPEMYTQMEEKNLSLRKTITLASLIQAEAGHVEQQPKVSGVFWNRLGGDWSRGTMGSDVTLRYVKIWMQWNQPEFANKTYREISYDEARTAVGDDLFYAYVTDDSDTRSRAGLPAGPICSVSQTAIEAALNPEGHNYYYFLTDYYGNYFYATTYDEHMENVKTMKANNEKFAQENAASQKSAA